MTSPTPSWRNHSDGSGVDHGFYPYKFFAEYCPFMAPLRGMPEFDRIVANAGRRVAELTT